LGKYFKVKVSNPKNSNTVESGASAQVTWPAITGKPVIAGLPADPDPLTVGTTLTANISGLTGLTASGTTAYQWKRGDTSDGEFTDISGETLSAYTVANADAGKYLKVEVRNTKNSGAVLSDAVKVIPTIGLVTVTFTGPHDETIDLTGVDGSVLSWSAETPLIVTVSGDFSGYRWALDDAILEGKTGNSLTLNAGTLSAKSHNLTVFVKKNGVEYAKRVTFTVTQ
jgi:hypothetical protein